VSERRIAVVGAGWTGLAAAVTLAAAGRAVTVLEAAPVLGGRARRVELRQGVVDNGQHLVLGAYRETLALIKAVHGERPQRELFERRRLHIEELDGFRLNAPPLPAPWHAITALLTMRGIRRPARLATVAFARRLRRGGFRCAAPITVASLLVDQPPDVVSRLWEPLCVSALNTPIDRASGQVFLNLLHRVFGVSARDSDMLLPRVDLGALFPDAAARFMTARGGEIRSACTVSAVQPLGDEVAISAGSVRESFAAAIICAGPHQLAPLLATLPKSGPAGSVAAQVAAFDYQPIVTAYLRYPQALPVPQPMLKLDGQPAQWLFDRGQLGGQAGLAAAVISTDIEAARGDHATLLKAIDAQLRRALRDLPPPEWSQVIAEQRATFACVAGMERPATGPIAPRVYLAGDYTDPDLPGTLESATRSGVSAARQVLAAHL
jgi:squalene-associated FAD-dependent desaturase